MNVPMNFLNKNDINYIDYIIDIYLFISTEEKKLVSYKEKEYILKSFSKRQLIDSEVLINLCSVIILVILCFEESEIDGLNIVEARHILLKLITYHFDEINDECFVDNGVLFKYIYNSIKQSRNRIKLNNKEIYTYNFLKLLQL